METELIAPVGLFICSLVISTRIEISVVIYWDIKISVVEYSQNSIK